MRTFDLNQEQSFARPLGEIFSFFSDAANLARITPPWMRFEILTPLPIAMSVGALIDYRIWIARIPLRWTTEITLWEPPRRFVDEQKRGPYRLWVHDHRFEERDGRVQVVDHVRYAVPGGALVERFFVRPRLEQIFGFRRQALHDILEPGDESGSR